MAKRRHKRRTHVREELDTSIPRSMVIKMGSSHREPTKSLGALVKDFRLIMQPHTAAKLRERRSNKLKDYLVMAGPLGVSHFFLFSQSESGNTTLRIARTPRGPTLYFRVLEYMLAKDVQKMQSRPHALTHELQTPPLLVMNGFSKEKTSDKEALLTSMFHNMLPSINVQNARLSSISRVLLLNKDPETGDIELRQYAIVVKSATASKAVRRLAAAQQGKKEIPNLRAIEDVADYMADPGLSESEAEDEVVEEPHHDGQDRPKKAIRLIEVGPRLKLRLLKIEDGLCQGRTLFHAHETRTAKEAAKLEQEHKRRDNLRAQRRQEQEENLRKKREGISTRSQRGKLRFQTNTDAENKQSENDSSDEPRDDHMQDPENMNDYELDAELVASE